MNWHLTVVLFCKYGAYIDSRAQLDEFRPYAPLLSRPIERICLMYWQVWSFSHCTTVWFLY